MEYDEILRRHRTVLRELQGSAGTAELYVIAADPDTGRNYYWAAPGLSDAEVDSLLLAAADDQGRFVIGAPNLEMALVPLRR